MASTSEDIEENIDENENTEKDPNEQESEEKDPNEQESAEKDPNEQENTEEGLNGGHHEEITPRVKFYELYLADNFIFHPDSFCYM